METKTCELCVARKNQNYPFYCKWVGAKVIKKRKSCRKFKDRQRKAVGVGHSSRYL